MKQRIKDLTLVLGVLFMVVAVATSHGAATQATYQPKSHPLAQNRW